MNLERLRLVRWLARYATYFANALLLCTVLLAFADVTVQWRPLRWPGLFLDEHGHITLPSIAWVLAAIPIYMVVYAAARLSRWEATTATQRPDAGSPGEQRTTQDPR